MAGPALTPALALEYLAELSTDIRAGVLLDSGGGLAASWEADDERGERVRELEQLVGVDRRAGEPPPAKAPQLVAAWAAAALKVQPTA